MSKRLLSDSEKEFRRKRSRLNSEAYTEESHDPHSFCSISKLSDEILLNIFKMLPLNQVIACQGVSHRWQELSVDPELWKRLYFLRFVLPRFAHVHSRTRTRIAWRDWWDNERTHKEGEDKKDWKHMFKVRYNWHNGRCAVSEMDILDSPQQLPEAHSQLQTSFWDELVLSVSAPLVQFDGKIFIAADPDIGLRAWDIGRMEDGKRKLIGCRRFHKYEQGWQLGNPTALGISGARSNTDVVVGFDTGGAMILRLIPSDAVEGQELGFIVRSVLPPNLVPEKLLHAAYSHPFLVTLDASYYLRAYIFDSDSAILQPPRSLATLHAQALQGPCNLTLRRPKSGSEQSITASIAYSTPILHGGWSVGIQEVVFDTLSANGIGQTRIGACIPPAYNLINLPDQPQSRVHSMSVPVTSPTSISYSHPYLLTSHRDNTLTLYLARTSEKEITIGQPRRLWGHTTGVARAGVAGRGRAVSVSHIGGEVRVWELESIAAAVSKSNAEMEDGAVVGIVESVRIENHYTPLSIGKEMFLDAIPSRTARAVEWIGFDEEKVLVVTSEHERDKNVTLYDFTC